MSGQASPVLHLPGVLTEAEIDALREYGEGILDRTTSHPTIFGTCSRQMHGFYECLCESMSCIIFALAYSNNEKRLLVACLLRPNPTLHKGREPTVRQRTTTTGKWPSCKQSSHTSETASGGSQIASDAA